MSQAKFQAHQPSKHYQTYYSNNWYRSGDFNRGGQIFSRRDFLEQISETAKIFDLKKRPLPGPIVKTDSEKVHWPNTNQSHPRPRLHEHEKIKSREPERRELFLQSEIGLWSNKNWRRRDKNLENNFNKLSPINEGHYIGSDH